jgi:hypothetical protein
MRASVLLLLLGLGQASFSQLSQGGRPIEWDLPLDQGSVPVITLEGTVEVPAFRGQPGAGEFDYGTQRTIQIDVPAQGEWTDLEDGWRLCRVAVESPGAIMMSLQFDRWELPAGALVYVYDDAREHFIGGFDQSNRAPDGTMATAVLPGDRIVVEYRVPPATKIGELHISSLTHGYRDIFGFRSEGRDIDPGYQSAACHININCPEAATWQDQKRAVALFLRPTGAGCTGVLLNNTAQPGRPFFHVANHCYQPTESQWVFYFNYESAGCVGTTGPSDQTLTGATLRASYYYDDFVLLELFNTPPASYNVYYAGWDRTGNTPTAGTVIHHPLYDVKKITFNTGPVTSAEYESFQTWRNYWTQGIVEAVSSGAPMFDQNKRMVGHMLDGSQTCSNAATSPTYCAKFSESWDGSSSTTRLRDWLDPANTTTQLNGYDPNASPNPTVKVRVRAMLEGPYDSSTQLMTATLRANGLVPLNEPYTNIGYQHVNGGGGESTTSSVLSVTGTNSIVDWVVIELRNKNNSSQVLATRSALIQRDGDVVATDGTSDVSFNMAADQYFIAVRHRNHLGIMTATAQTLSTTATLIDMSSSSASLFGGANATKTIGTRKVMFAGDVNSDGLVKYTGSNNDRDQILVTIGGVIPTNVVNAYTRSDVNMDGSARYTGANNDRDMILINIGGTIPSNVKQDSLP